MLVRFIDNETNVKYIVYTGCEGKILIQKESEIRQNIMKGTIGIPYTDDSDIRIVDTKEVLYGDAKGSSFILVKMDDCIFSYDKAHPDSLIKDVIGYVEENKMPDRVRFTEEPEEGMIPFRISALYISMDKFGHSKYISTELKEVKTNGVEYVYVVTPEMNDFQELEGNNGN